MKLPMRIKALAFLFCAIGMFNQLNAQSLKKAQKYFELRQYDKAIEVYKKLLEKTPDDKTATFELAECYYVQNALLDANRLYEKHINDQDIDTKYLFHYAQSLRSLGSLDEAKIWFKILAGRDSILGPHYLKACERMQSFKAPIPSMEVKNEFINTEGKEFAPVYINNQFVFGSSRTDISFPGKKLKIPTDGKSFNRLFQTTADQNGYLKPPMLFHPELQDQSNDMPLSYSQDGKWVVFTMGNWGKTERPFSFKGEGLALFIAKVSEQGVWTDVKPMPFNNTQYSNTWPCLTENGMKLYFVSNKPGGSGGYDIYVSQRFGDKWSEPANIGKDINTPGDEISPFLSGNTLYFSSDWHPGYGGFDICKAELSDGVWGKASVLDNGVNTTYDDYGFIWDKTKNSGYLVSNRENGKGADDLYRVKRIGEPFSFIIEDNDAKPIPYAIVDLTSCGLSVLNSNLEGKVNIKTLPKEKCTCTVSLEGYEPKTIEITRDDVFSSKQQKVVLIPRIVQFVFKFITKDKGDIIPGVNVEVSSQTEQKVENFVSDEKGQVSVNLQKDKMYFLKTNMENFKPESKLINTSARTEPSILVLVPLEKINSGNASNTAANSEKFFRTKGIYAIQVNTVSKNGKLDTKKYEDIIANTIVYSIKENKSVKVRIGNFPNKSEAEKALRILEKKNITGGFIVEDSEYANAKPANVPAPKVVEVPKEMVVKNTPKDAPKDTPKELAKDKDVPAKIEPTAPVVAAPPPPDDNFRVRIAAVRDPKFTEDPKLKELGTILLEPRGEFTAVYIGYFKEQKDAAPTLQKAKTSGFKDAYIVKKKDKTWVKAK